MASEFLDADKPRLELLAELHHQFWIATAEGKNVVPLAAEIRHQDACFGLSPIDRRRLQWEVEKAEHAVERTVRRRASRDPRATLRVT